MHSCSEARVGSLVGSRAHARRCTVIRARGSSKRARRAYGSPSSPRAMSVTALRVTPRFWSSWSALIWTMALLLDGLGCTRLLGGPGHGACCGLMPPRRAIVASRCGCLAHKRSANTDPRMSLVLAYASTTSPNGLLARNAKYTAVGLTEVLEGHLRRGIADQCDRTKVCGRVYGPAQGSVCGAGHAGEGVSAQRRAS